MIEPDANEFKNMMPRPLSARYMPPLEVDDEEDDEEEQENDPTGGGSGGFGGGGFGAGGGKKTGGKNTKEAKKKKPKARDGSRSDNPQFKKSGKTAFANRK